MNHFIFSCQTRFQIQMVILANSHLIRQFSLSTMGHTSAPKGPVQGKQSVRLIKLKFFELEPRDIAILKRLKITEDHWRSLKNNTIVSQTIIHNCIPLKLKFEAIDIQFYVFNFQIWLPWLAIYKKKLIVDIQFASRSQYLVVQVHSTCNSAISHKQASLHL